MGRIARSFELFKQSWRVLMRDKELIVLPVLSGAAILAVATSFVLGMGLTGDEALAENDPKLWLAGFAFYVAAYTVAFFFQAAVVAGASERMSGGDPTLGSALGAAGRRFPAIFMWGVIAATVGMILRMIQDRSEALGKIVVGIIGVVWSFATFFMVPILVMERRSVPDSFKQSWALFKKTWGETVVANIGFGLIGLFAMLPAIAVAAFLFNIGLETVGLIVGVISVCLVLAVFSALQGVFVAALYRYATMREAVEGFDSTLLASAFRRKGARA